MKTVDVWAQVATERMLKEPWLESLLRWAGGAGIPLPTTHDLIAGMDASHVDVSIISAWYGPSGSLISNEEVSAQIEAAPARLRGLASADLRRPMDAVRELRTWVDGKRFVGVRMLPWLWELPPNDRRYYPIYSTCVELGVPFCTQIGHTGPLRSSDVGRLIPYLEDVLLDFPELVVVGGHVGFPWLDEVASLTVKFPNFYVDTSAYALHRLPDNFVSYMKGIGKHRVMFGTNWPMIPQQKCLAKLDQLGLDEEQKSRFLSETARRVFKL